MPIQLNTPALKTMYTSFESAHRTSQKEIGRSQMLDLLAQAGSAKGTSKQAVLAQLNRPGITADQQVAVLKNGLTGKERADLQKIFEKGPVPLAADAKALLAKVVASWATPLPAANDRLETFTPRPAGPNLTGGARINLPDPDLHPDEKGPRGEALFKKQLFTGPLFGAQGPTLEGVRQGYLSDCYFVAGLASVLQSPGGKQHIANMVKDNGDGTYSVTFKERDRKMKFQDVEVKVDAELYVNPDGSALYGKTGEGANKAGDMKLFFPIIEKAYASWKGGYENIAEDTAANLYEAVLGKSATHQSISMKGEKYIGETINSAISQGRPITAGTRGEGKELQVTDVNGKKFEVYSEHQYSVFGASVVNGQQQVTLRNPWGKIDRADSGSTGGVFTVDMATFKKCFASLSFVDAAR